VRSLSSLGDFRDFVSALEGVEVTIKNTNFRALSRLSEEFGFGDLTSRLSEFRNSSDFKEEPVLEDSEARAFLSALEARLRQCEALSSAEQTELVQQLRAQGSAMEDLVRRVAQLEADNATRAGLSTPWPPQIISPTIPGDSQDCGCCSSLCWMAVLVPVIFLMIVGAFH
jgi:hypothetical protein